MIGSLRGTVTERKPEGIVIDVGGVGYEVTMAPSAVEKLPGERGETVISTHMHVWADGMRLYGFGHSEERDLFRVLLSAQGVGPKMAMAVLSTLAAQEVRQAVRQEDVAAFTRVNGVGKKTAQRLILDLKGKLEASEANVLEGASRSADLWAALSGLGYRTHEIRRATGTIDTGAPFEDQLKTALAELGR